MKKLNISKKVLKCKNSRGKDFLVYKSRYKSYYNMFKNSMKNKS